jgi:hypothetical protein
MPETVTGTPVREFDMASGQPVAMDEEQVRSSADAFGDALVAGDVDRAVEPFSDELRRNLGEVIALLPLPVTEATIETIERGSSAYVVTSRLVGESDEVELQTRWKDRDGTPTVVEVSHLSRTARPEPAEDVEAEAPIEA